MTREVLHEIPDSNGADGRPARRRWPVFAALLLVLAPAAAWGVHRVRAPGFPASDARACAGSTEPLEQKARDLGLALPRNTRHLAYLSSGKPPYPLAMSFSIGVTDLQQWLAANKLPTPERDTQAGTVGAPCGADLEDAFADPVATQTVLPYGASLAIAIDMNGVPAAPSRPTVL
ncbi:MAG TPA: hypothetical protein VGL02_15665, partial [Streptomyces sp.]